jgi:hypothetical protein
MSKATEARVRDELLQTLYTHVLRCQLAAAAQGGRSDDAATAAGVFANLEPGDSILLPARHGSSLRMLRGLSIAAATTGMTRDRAARVYGLPADEAQAVAYALAMGLAAADAPSPGGLSSAVVVVLPPRVVLQLSRATLRQMPRTWSDGAAYAARAALPLLFVSIYGSPAGKTSAAGAPADAGRPAPLFPSIPVDREDALAVYRVAFESLARARAGGGPSELAAGRYPALTGMPSGGLDRLEAMLRKRGCFSKAWQRSLDRELTRAIAESV